MRTITWPQGGAGDTKATVPPVADADDGRPAPPEQPAVTTQAAIPSLPNANVTALTDAATAVNQTRATLNAILAELRAAGILAP